MDASNNTLRVAVAGCGYWGMNYLRVFNELPGACLAGACDVRRERLDEVLRRFPSVFVATELNELLAEAEVDAVVICTEATSHHAVALRCLQAGKHILVEKPLTTGVSEAEELTTLAEMNQRILMVGHTFIYNAAVRKMKEYVRKDHGQIYYLYAQRTNLGPIRHDVNALWDLATHDIAIFNYLLESTPDWVSAVGARVLCNGREDVGFITLSYPGNVLGHIHVSWADPNKTREVVVVLGDRRIVFNDLNGLEQVRVFEKGIRAVSAEPVGYGEYRLQIRDGDIVSPKVEVREPLKDQCRHFMECIELGAEPMTAGREGIDVLRVLSAVDRSVALCGAQVEVQNDRHFSRKTVVRAVSAPVQPVLAATEG
jgi:predicted dehydrogenase